MFLLWLILDQKKNEKQAEADGLTLAVSIQRRLTAYFICTIPFIILGFLISLNLI